MAERSRAQRAQNLEEKQKQRHGQVGRKPRPEPELDTIFSYTQCTGALNTRIAVAAQLSSPFIFIMFHAMRQRCTIISTDARPKWERTIELGRQSKLAKICCLLFEHSSGTWTNRMRWMRGRVSYHFHEIIFIFYLHYWTDRRQNHFISFGYGRQRSVQSDRCRLMDLEQILNNNNNNNNHSVNCENKNWICFSPFAIESVVFFYFAYGFFVFVFVRGERAPRPHTAIHITQTFWSDPIKINAPRPLGWLMCLASIYSICNERKR